MKKNVFFWLVFLLFCLPSIVSAQLTRGCFMAGGGASFSWFRSETTPTNIGGTGFSGYFSPSITYFLINRLGVGASFNTGFSKTDNSKGSDVSAGPRARFYFKDSRPVAFFAEVAALYGRSTNEWTNPVSGTSRFESSFRNIKAGLGMNYFLNQSNALELTLAWDNISGSNSSTQNNIRFGVGFATFFGRNRLQTTLKN